VTATREDYDRAIRTFVEEMRELGPVLRGILLYGSVAHAGFRPGKSDLLDAYVFLDQGALASREGYRRAVGRLVEACVTLSESGLPYKHAAHYHGADETSYLPGEFLPEMLSDDYSTVLHGEELRSTFPAAQDGLNTATIEEVRQYGCLPLAKFLAPDELSVEDRESLARGLDMWFRKLLPVWACASVGQPTPAPVAVDKLRQLFPDLDFSAIEDILELKKRLDGTPTSQELQRLLRRCLVMTEKLYERMSRQPQ
jgi:hypothetical protein